jgi:hypothetical protein
MTMLAFFLSKNVSFYPLAQFLSQIRHPINYNKKIYNNGFKH